MSELVFFLEEPSAEALLSIMVPKLLPDLPLRFVVFEGKQDLEKQMVRRMRGYLVPGAKFVVLRDQDAADCHSVKRTLRKKCGEAGKPDALVRIACRELESWYLADLAAVEKGLSVRRLARLQAKAKFCVPDRLASPARELRRIAPVYQKIGGSRAIAPHLDLDNRRSTSFAHFVSAIRKLGADLSQRS